MHNVLSALIVTGVSEARRIAARFVVTMALMAASVAPAWAGPPGPPGVNPPPASAISCLVAVFAGEHLSLTGKFTVSDDKVDTLVVTFGNGLTVTVTYTDGGSDGFHCADVAAGFDSITDITVNAP